MSTIRLLIADDHKIVRNGLQSIFEEEEGFQIIGEAENGKELVDKAFHLQPDVVISDFKMPGMNGIEAARAIKARVPSAKIMIFTAFAEKDEVQQAVEAGVDGYMIKDTLPDELVKAVELIHKGYSCIFFNDLETVPKGRKCCSLEGEEGEPFTDREMEVYQLIAQNYSNQEIAQKLYISEATVKSHVSRILKKTGQPNRAQAVLYGLSKGMFNMNDIGKKETV